MPRRRAALAACLIITMLGGCAVGVKPWQHDVLARKSMQLNPDPNVTAFNEHIYFSKEAASGGRSYDGGGCGCN